MTVKFVVMHKVADFDKWKAVFDSDEQIRKEGGEVGNCTVLRGIDDTTVVALEMEWESPEKLKAFMESDVLKQKMEEAGVTEMPRMFVLQE